MREFLFSYGTLQKTEVQAELFGRTLIGFPDSLRNYKTTQIEIRNPEFVLKSAQRLHSIAIRTSDNTDTITGTALEITPEELLIADKYEPEEYKRVQVTLDSGGHAWIYTSA